MATAKTSIQKSFTAIIPFTKDAVVNEDDRIIQGYATTGSIDEDEQIISQKAVEDALKPYTEYPTIRADHRPPPVGKTIAGVMDKRGLNVKVQIGKNITACDDAWNAIKQGLYTAFSVGGKILEVKKSFNKLAGKDIETVTKLKILEISLTDSPANRDCFFDVIKSAVKATHKGGATMPNDDPKNKEEENKTPDAPETPDYEKRFEAIEKGLGQISEQLAKTVPADTTESKPEDTPEEPSEALKKALLADIRKDLGIAEQKEPNRAAHQQNPNDITAPPTTEEPYSLRKAILRTYQGEKKEES
ncbi:MAG: HK97 family phage prohead protease [Candidatus Aureabacteria bacterium]|nr:HK97 family phage prohead protease [Candidatus Auribacterota bacterium]